MVPKEKLMSKGTLGSITQCSGNPEYGGGFLGSIKIKKRPSKDG